MNFSSVITLLFLGLHSSLGQEDCNSDCMGNEYQRYEKTQITNFNNLQHLVPTEAASVKACEEQCKAKENCQLSQYDPDMGVCYLYGLKEGITMAQFICTDLKKEDWDIFVTRFDCEPSRTPEGEEGEKEKKEEGKGEGEKGPALDQYCRKNGPSCSTPHTECHRSSRCKCIKAEGWVRYPTNNTVCVEQTAIPLNHYCSSRGKRCHPENSVCAKSHRCKCLKGHKKNGDKCDLVVNIVPVVV